MDALVTSVVFLVEKGAEWMMVLRLPNEVGGTFAEPRGFALDGADAGTNRTLEMEARMRRLLVALLGGTDEIYLNSPVDTPRCFALDQN